MIGAMPSLLGSLLHAVLLAGMLVLVTFRPDHIARWPRFHLAVVLLVLALVLPALAPLSAAPVDAWPLRVVSALSGVLTAFSIYCVLTCGPGARATGTR
jgi:hypothetical protein